MLAEEVKPEDSLPRASIYVSRRSQTGRYSSGGFHIEEVKPEETLPGSSIYVSRRSQTGKYSPSGFHICQQKKSNRKILAQGLPYMLAEEVKPEDTLPWASIYVSRRSKTGRFSPQGFHICQQKKSNRKILSHGLPYMLAEEVKPEDSLPRASIYVSRRSQTGRYSSRGFHICQQKKSNRKILAQGLPYMLAEEVKPEDTLPAASIYVSRRSQTGTILSHGLPYMLGEVVKAEDTLPGASAEVVNQEDTLPGASIYVSRRSQTGRYSPSGFHICQQKKSNRKILAQGLPYMLAEEVKPEDNLPWASIYVSRRSQTGRFSPKGFHICQQKKSNRKILFRREEVKPEETSQGIYVSRRSQTGKYSRSGFHICQQKKSNRKILPRGFHICQQKKSNRKILSQGLPYMLAEEVKPDNTLPVATIYVSRRSQSGRYSSSSFHICQQKKSNRTILSQGLPYMLAEEVKPEDTRPGASIYVSRRSQTGRYSPGASIYVSRRSQTGRYSPRGFHICQQKKSNRKILSHSIYVSRRSQTGRYSPRASIYVSRRSQTGRYSSSRASIYVSRRSQTGRYSPRGFHICQQKKSNRKILSQGLPYMLAEEVKPEDTLPGASIYVSRRSQTGRYSPRGFHIAEEVKPSTLPGASKKSNRKILAQGLPYMLAEEVKPEDTLPWASIYVSRRSKTGRFSPQGFHICQQKKSNRKILFQGLPYMLAEEVKPEDNLQLASIYVTEEVKPEDTLPYMLAEEVKPEDTLPGASVCQQKKSNRKILSLGLPYMLAEEVKPEVLPGASIYVSRRSQTGRYSLLPYMLGSNRIILSQWLPYMLAEEVKPEDTLPGASIYVSRRSQTGRYSPRGFHICQQKKSNRKILSQGFHICQQKKSNRNDTLPGASIYVSRRSQTGRYKLASIYVSRRSQTGRYSPRGFHICEQKKSNRKILFRGFPYRRSQTGRDSPRVFHICQQKKSNRKILSQWLPYMLAEEVKPEDTRPWASIYVSRRSQTGRYSPRASIYVSRRSQTGRYSPRASIYVSRRSQTGRYSSRGFHICQQKKSNRKIISNWLPYMLREEVKPEDTLPSASIYVSRRGQTGRYSPRGFRMLAEEVKPEDTLPGASIYVSRRSQTGSLSPRGFHICQQKKSNRKILSLGLPYMLAEEVKPEDTIQGASLQTKSNRKILSQRLPYIAEEVKPEDTLRGASIYVSRRSQSGRYSSSGFHICQQKKSNRTILSQGLPYMLAEEVKPEDTRPGASIYVSRRSQTGRYSSSGFHICQQKQSNRTILSHGLPYMLAEEVKPEDTLPGASAEVVKQEDTLPGASIYVSRRSQTGRYSPSGFHICQQKKSNRKILAQGLPYMLAEEVKPEDNLPWASIYVSRRSQTGRFSPKGFHICQQKKSNRKILFRGFPYRRSQTGRDSPRVFNICQQKKSNRKIISQWLPYMLAEEVKPEDTRPGASIYVSRRSQTGRYSPMGFHICQQKK